MGEIYKLNEIWEIKPRLNRISDITRSFTIPPKYMEVLLYLIKNSGDVVSRDELLSVIWQDAIVVEESLTRAISELRKILQDDPRDPKIIETIPKRGYRLIATVQYEATSSKREFARIGSGKEKKIKPFGIIMLVITLCIAAFFIYDKWLSHNLDSSPPVHLMPLTSYPGQESFPVLSPDGNRLAFRWDGEDGFSASIYVKVVGSESPLRLTYEDFTTEPAWSQDGRFISYSKFINGSRAIYSVPSSSGPEKRIAQNLYGARNPVWSPDGSELVYAKHVEETSSTLIHIYSINTRESRTVTAPLNGRIFDSKPIFSPDGSAIAFIRTFTGEKDVFTISPDGSGLKKITSGGQWITDVDWSPDGRWIIYSSKEGIWKIAHTGGRATLLTAGGLRIENISVARNSWRLAYEQSNREVNIWKVTLPELDAAVPAPQRFISSSRADSEPVFSPDGRQIAFISDRTGDPQLWICRRDGSNLAQLTHFNGCTVHYPRWSHDGQKITFTAQLFGNSDIFIVNSEGGEPIQITRDHSRDIYSAWSRDARWIYFTSNKENGYQLWKKPVDGGDDVLVSSTSGFRATESFNGKTLYYEKIQAEGQGIWEKPVDGGRERRLFLLPKSMIADWIITETGIFYAKRTRGRDRQFEIGYYDFKSNTLKPIFQTEEPVFNFGFDPESRVALFAKEERNEGDIVLMENFQ